MQEGKQVAQGSELGKEVKVLIEKSFNRFMVKNLILKKKEI